MGVSKNRGKTTKMDGENHGKPYEQMDDLGGFHPYFWFNSHVRYPKKLPFFKGPGFPVPFQGYHHVGARGP